MEFLKDLINGHEAFFASGQIEKETFIRTKNTKASSLGDSSKEEVKSV